MAWVGSLLVHLLHGCVQLLRAQLTLLTDLQHWNGSLVGAVLHLPLEGPILIDRVVLLLFWRLVLDLSGVGWLLWVFLVVLRLVVAVLLLVEVGFELSLLADFYVFNYRLGNLFTLSLVLFGLGLSVDLDLLVLCFLAVVDILFILDVLCLLVLLRESLGLLVAILRHHHHGVLAVESGRPLVGEVGLLLEAGLVSLHQMRLIQRVQRGQVLLQIRIL